MGTIRTSLLHAPTDRSDAIASKDDNMNVPLPADHTLQPPLTNQAWLYFSNGSISK
jgi:hypothetical protein